MIVLVRYQQLTDELQTERDALHVSVAASEVQLQQQSAEIQQLHDQVAVCSFTYCGFSCRTV